MQIAGIGLAAVATSLAALSGSPHETTPLAYSHQITQICASSVLFDGTHAVGTTAGATDVSNAILSTGMNRMRRVAAVPKPAATAQTISRWITTERSLVRLYSRNYLRIWHAIDAANTPTQRAALPAALHALLHQPDVLQARAATLERALRVPDCTGGS